MKFMKKYAILAAIMLIGVTTTSVLVLSCKKQTDSKNPTSKTIFKRNYKTGQDFSTFGDHITQIDLLSINDTTLDSLKANSQWIHLVDQLDDSLNYDSIRRIRFDHSGITIIQIPIFDTSKCYHSLNIYEYRNKYIFSRAITSLDTNSYRKYVVMTGDKGSKYFQFYLSSNNAVGKFQFFNDIPFNTVFIPQGDQQCPTCQQQFPNSFGNCMKCAISECGQDWICAVVCAICTWECLTGFGLSCTGILPAGSSNQ
jgi:hypothetical protein